MKRALCIVAVLAMAVAFLPQANADDNANLTLNATFLVSPPITIYATNPPPPYTVKEGSELRFQVVAEGTSNLMIDLKATKLPNGATFVLDEYDDYIPNGRASGTFKWTPEITCGDQYIAEAEFKAHYSDGSVTVAVLPINITVTPGDPIVSITLNPTSWTLLDVAKGEIRTNIAYFGADPSNVIHRITNDGNVPVKVEIGYGKIPPPPISTIHPGVSQGADTYITGITTGGNSCVVIPPNETDKVTVAETVAPGMEIPLPLTYGAPTSFSAPPSGMNQGYVLVATFQSE